MQKSNLKAREDRQVSCLGIVEFHLPVYIQLEIGFSRSRLRRAIRMGCGQHTGAAEAQDWMQSEGEFWEREQC